MKVVALLRGINVGGNRQISMVELCALAKKLGFADVKHYINSGNLVFDAASFKPREATELLEKAIEKRFGFEVDVLVRTATQWKKAVAGNPFPSAAKNSPKFLHLGLSKERCGADLPAILGERARHGEKIKLVDGCIWIDFTAGVGKSKLTPALLDKAAGSPVTLRNWNTVLKIDELLAD